MADSDDPFSSYDKKPSPTPPSEKVTPLPNVTQVNPDQTEVGFSGATANDNLVAPSDESLFPTDIGKAPQVDANAPKKRIGERLIEAGLLSTDQLQVALQEQKGGGGRLIGQILVDMSFITESALAEFLAESAGTRKFDPKATMIDPQVITMIPKDIAQRNKVMPVSYDAEAGTIELAMADIYNVVAIDQVRRHLAKGVNIVPLFSTDSEIQELIEQYYGYEIAIDGILREIETGIREKDIASIMNGASEGYVNPTVRLVNALLIDAIKVGASDMHFEPEGTFLRLRFRIDGMMTQIRSFHRDYWPSIAVRLKIMSGMNIAETRMPQDGRISFTAMGREVDFRVATQPTVHGENIVLRLLDKTKSLVPLEQLGFSDHNIQLLKRMLRRPEGIIIVTGPTGSGKSTTLYSILSYINTMDKNIMTLEDPVEYQLPLIRQTSIKEGTVDFLSGIKSLMRQDPDIIFVGEVRDEETAMMSIRAAMTGHQVFTTLHTNDALGAIPRLNDIGVPSHLLAGNLICSMAQRLARKLCPHCRDEYVASPEECRIMGVPADNPPKIFRPKGCGRCGYRGVKGRTAIIEILRVDRSMDELISGGATRAQIRQHALDHGFVPMAEDGIQKVLQGDIDLNELIDTIDMTDRL